MWRPAGPAPTTHTRSPGLGFEEGSGGWWGEGGSGAWRREGGPGRAHRIRGAHSLGCCLGVEGGAGLLVRWWMVAGSPAPVHQPIDELGPARQEWGEQEGQEKEQGQEQEQGAGHSGMAAGGGQRGSGC